MQILLEDKAHHQGIRTINDTAFGGKSESKIVDAFRESGDLLLSMVALEDTKLIGHIAYSPMEFSKDIGIKAYALAPMAIHPDHQRKGIGSVLIKESLEIVKSQGVDFVFLIGHPEYYPKFGFKPAFSTFGVKSNYDVPNEVFMGIKLSENSADLNGLKVSFSKIFEQEG